MIDFGSMIKYTLQTPQKNLKGVAKNLTRDCFNRLKSSAGENTEETISGQEIAHLLGFETMTSDFFGEKGKFQLR